MVIEVTVDEDAKLEHETTLGRAIIFTNRHDWKPESVIWSYREQYIVEHAFEHMKCPTSIAIRPMYHHSDDCIRAHVFTCVLALLLLSLLRLKLARKGFQATYNEILESLQKVHVNKIAIPSRENPIFKLDKAHGIAADIIKKLGLARLVA